MLSRLRIKQSTVTLFSVIIFLLIIISMWGSTYYMRLCIKSEQAAEMKKYELKELGVKLADASNYLTDEARKFAVTTKISHLNNYWREINDIQTRDLVIETFKSLNPPEFELQFLEEAKKNSDTLVSTETHSMRLIIETLQHSKGDIPKEILTYKLSVSDKNLTPEEKHQKAIQMMYDAKYTLDKEHIMNPIALFQNAMNHRLDYELDQARKKTAGAVLLQVILSFISIMAIGLLLYVFHRLFNIPILNYTCELQKLNVGNAYLKLSPLGTQELQIFGNAFNTLYASLTKEISNKEQAEQIMKIAKEEAESANNAKSEFLAHMSHEIRTPLNTIIGYEYLLSNSPLDSNQKKYTSHIKTSSNNLLGIINNILDLSKIESGKLQIEQEPFDLTALLDEIYNILSLDAHNKGLNLALDIEGNIPQFLKGDPLRLKQILINLISNAIKFTHHGGVTLHVAQTSNAKKSITLLFKVMDTGIGITQAHQTMIFESFMQGDTTTTRKYGGSGLGLAISKQLVALLGSKLVLQSEYGKGSTFSFSISFKLSSYNSTESNLQLLPYSSLNFKGKSLLLVDDNEINLLMEKEILLNLGFDVDVANNGLLATKKAETKCFDMILMDIRMPDMDGYETTKHIRQFPHNSLVPIIALTADAVKDVCIKALASGMNASITKPLNVDELIALFMKYLTPNTVAINKNITPSTLATLDTAFLENKMLDVTHCLKILDYNLELYINLLQKFTSYHNTDLTMISSALDQAHYETAILLLHALKGTSGNIGAKPLMHLVQDLELFLKQENDLDLTQLSLSYQKLEIVFLQTFSAIENLLTKCTLFSLNKSTPGFGSNSFDFKNKSAFTPIMHQIVRHFDLGEIEGISLFEKYQKEIYNYLSLDLFNALIDSVYQYNFEKSTSIIQKALRLNNDNE